MAIRLIVASLGMVWSASVTAQQYPLLCRGPLKLTAEPGVTALVAEGTRNRMGAGSQGEQLAEGSCAWVDRPLNDQEEPAIGVGAFEYENTAFDSYDTKTATQFAYKNTFTAYRATILAEFGSRSDYVIKKTGAVLEFIPLRGPRNMPVPEIIRP